MVEQEVCIALKGALMTREAAQIAQQMKAFSSRVLLREGDMTVNGKSLMGIVSLALRDGRRITVIADGEDEGEAVAAFARLAGGN